MYVIIRITKVENFTEVYYTELPCVKTVDSLTRQYYRQFQP